MTKPFGALPPGRLAATLAALGAGGAELVVREGQTVTPAQPARLHDAARELTRHGLRLGVVTTDLTEAGGTADAILGACADLGVPLVRLGWWRYDATVGYQRILDRARRDLAGLAVLGRRHGVRLALQLHHGTIHPSAAHALRLTDELAIYLDPGNQAMEGSEQLAMSLDLLGDRLACVGVKNAAWRDGGLDWQPLADGGVVDWPEALRTLRERGYTGPLSLHAHYPTADPVADVGRDLAHLGRL
ncbi:sugar phosphate isomerase/epimerase family protein [Actinoplanes sp. NPDC049599]|uniref:sugar phosphate isomerase/epimerase family protein n=1 Tax=Actinoplanes sp. NPDC049599 TaxID=3363903 RepID=UPI003794921B